MAVTRAFDTAALPDRAAFAVANGMVWTAASAPPDFGGAVFEFLQESTATDRYVGDGFEVGTITGKPGGSQARAVSGGTVRTSYSTSEQTTYGYLAVRLQRALPQFVLDSVRNDAGTWGSSVPMPIASGQQLNLEGDFDSYFTLYAPKGYERDALYVFAPDLMSLLVDETGDLDVEIVDDMFFAYATRPFDTAAPATWERLARIRDVVGGKAITQTDLYADDRSAEAGTVSETGRRLRMGFFGGGGGNTKLWLAVGIGVGIIGLGVPIIVFVVLSQAF